MSEEKITAEKQNIDHGSGTGCPESAPTQKKKGQPLAEVSYGSAYFESLSRRLAERRPPVAPQTASSPTARKVKSKTSRIIWMTVRRTLLVLLVLLLLFIIAVYSLCTPSPWSKSDCEKSVGFIRYAGKCDKMGAGPLFVR